MQSRYVILDANVVIDAHRLGVWKALVTQYKITVTNTIAAEVQFYEGEDGTRYDIDLFKCEEEGIIEIIESEVGEIESVAKKLNPEYAKKVDPGELGAIALIHSGRLGDEFRFCTADGVAIKVMSALGIGSFAVPACKLLEAIGYKKPLPWRYGEEYFKAKLADGLIEKRVALRK